MTVTDIRPVKKFDRGQLSIDSIGLLDGCRIIDRRKTSENKFRLYRTPDNRDERSRRQKVALLGLHVKLERSIHPQDQ